MWIISAELMGSLGAEATSKDALNAMAACDYGASFILAPFLIDYFRRVLRPTEHLACLGAGRVMISARAATNLRKWISCCACRSSS